MMIHLLTLFLLPTLVTAFFGLGGGGCGCSQPACPPPPAPVCAPPPQPVCPPPRPCVHGSKTEQTAPITLPDELELRAAAFGVPVHQSQNFPSNIEQLEKLVERYEPIESVTEGETLLAEPVSAHEADDDLVRAGLRRSADVRRSPTVVISHQEDAEPNTTVASTTGPEEEAETEKVKEEATAQNKCNSQVLHKLMMDNISDNSSESKRKINTAAEEKFGGNVDVVCSRGHFSYVFSSNLYCEATKGLTTCIAFRQAA